MKWKHIQVGLISLAMLMSQCAGGADEIAASQLTPPRLSYFEGSVSFWRAGAQDWAPARVNTPLAPGDAFYTADRAAVELQVGSRAFVRAQEKTHFSLSNIEMDYLQLALSAGRASLDLRNLPPSHSVELGTPNAIFTIEHSGYYRVEVDENTTRFTTRRGGRAIVTTEWRAHAARARQARSAALIFATLKGADHATRNI